MKQSMRALRAVTAMLLAAALTGSLSACRREETPVSAPESGAASNVIIPLKGCKKIPCTHPNQSIETEEMKRMKKILALLLASVMVLGLAACGGDKTNPSGGTKATSGSTAVSAPPALTLYAAPASLPAGLKNTDYTFQVKGGGKDWQKVAAYNVKVDPELPANTRVVDGKGNTIEPKVQNSPLISFDLSGRAEVSITKNRGTFNASAVKVYPESLGIKPTVSGNKLTFAKMEDNIDFDASPLIYGQRTLEELGDDLLQMVVDTANGKQTKAESLGFTEMAIARVCNYV